LKELEKEISEVSLRIKNRQKEINNEIKPLQIGRGFSFG
jgi:hypothetical protein